MELSYLAELSWLSFLLLLGVLVSLLAARIRFPDVLLLLIVGVIIGSKNFISFGESFLTSFGIFAMVMIIFESTAKFKPREVVSLSPYSLKLALVFLFINLFALTVFTHLLFSGLLSWKLILLSLTFAAMMSGTAPDAVLSLLKEKISKVTDILEIESIINTPLTVIIPLIVLKLYLGVLESTQTVFFSFIQEIVTGIGAGLVIGYVTFTAMKRTYIEKVSPLIIVAVALVTYTLATYLGGSGVLAVTSLAVLFGIIEIEKKVELQKFVGIFTNFLRIVLFILLGLIIRIPFDDINFLLKSVLLFGIFIFIRFSAVQVTFKESALNWKEKIFMSLNVSKGVAVIVVAFILLSAVSHDYINTILNLSFLFIFYSILVSSVVNRFSGYFLESKQVIKRLKAKKNETKNIARTSG